ncbi:PREDICTED: uncharacterized protein LOC104774237 [Camelina sativa]|uniref:Uncharacterized protein LOC104774237 n=1 Tax=Camelina sativa TaxID=90675 RepID=A0ABM0Y8I1_CAMSA|nr:PREDICTED: uncharacterized protein LOC104774237 [Camelina sativa]
MKLNKLHSDYERQMKEMAEEVKRFSLEAGVLKAEFEGEQSSCSASCENQINHTPVDSELKELKEEFNKLSTLVSQMEMTKSQFSETDKEVQGEPVERSITSKNTDDQSTLEPSQPENSEETLCKKDQSKAEVCCSCTKKSLCKTKSCKCRANGSGCGDSCGCLASKCSNREEENLKPMQPVDAKKPAGISHDDKDANKQPLRDIGNIQEAVKVGKLRKVQKRVSKK